VRVVRSNDAHGHVPILILSGSGDPRTIDRAYALGANSYVTTNARGRRTSEIVRTIYDHWLRDTRLPMTTLATRTADMIARGMSIRSRIAQHYMAIAERLGGARGEFWMGVAQREGNLANLLMFLGQQLDFHTLPDDILDEIEAHQREVLRVLDAIRARPPASEDDAFRYLLALSAPIDHPSFARAVGLLFPASPLAIAAMLEGQARTCEAVAAELDARTSDPSLHEAAARVRTNVAVLRSLRADEGAPAPAPAAPFDR
jgi:CheY-like chemotaxis protein